MRLLKITTLGMLLALCTNAYSQMRTLPVPTPAPIPIPTTTILDPTWLRISYGDSSLEFMPSKHPNANSFRVIFTASPTCPVPPQVALQVKYAGNDYWYNTTVEQGTFKHSGFTLAAMKVLFRQLKYQSVDCQMSITGTSQTQQ